MLLMSLLLHAVTYVITVIDVPSVACPAVVGTVAPLLLLPDFPAFASVPAVAVLPAVADIPVGVDIVAVAPASLLSLASLPLALPSVATDGIDPTVIVFHF
jgi:hypothetical protein